MPAHWPESFNTMGFPWNGINFFPGINSSWQQQTISGCREEAPGDRREPFGRRERASGSLSRSLLGWVSHRKRVNSSPPFVFTPGLISSLQRHNQPVSYWPEHYPNLPNSLAKLAKLWSHLSDGPFIFLTIIYPLWICQTCPKLASIYHELEIQYTTF